MGRKHRLERIAHVGLLLGECVRGRAVRVVGGWGEQGAGYKGAGRPPLPRGGDGRRRDRDPKQSGVNYSEAEERKESGDFYCVPL